MKVKVIQRFVDKYTDEFYKIDQIIDVSKKRYLEIEKYVTLIEDTENKNTENKNKKAKEENKG